MKTEAERFWSKVDRTGECWTWTACLNSRGYGVISIEARRQLAHRVSYTWAKGPIADGLQVDHLCFEKRCVNPAHLEAVTARENTLRSRKSFATDQHCARGHEWSERNHSVRRDGRRRCLQCLRDDNKRWRDDLRGAPAREYRRRASAVT